MDKKISVKKNKREIKQNENKKSLTNDIESKLNFIPGVNDWLICSSYPAVKKIKPKKNK